MSDRALLFLHVPKAAGMSLHHVLNRKYSSRVTFDIDGFRVHECIDELKHLPERDRARLRLVKGHMPFGLHAWLPGPSTYVTLMRDPVDRVISHYYFVRRTPRHALHERVTAAGMSLRDYVESGASIELDNGQVRLLSGSGASPPFGECGPEQLEAARRNLREHFAVVGLSDRFEETLILMKRALGWRLPPLYITKNVSRRRPPKDGIDGETRRVIERHNELDRALHDEVRASFEAAIEADRGEIEAELARLRRWNRVYRGFVSPLWSAWSLLRGWGGGRAAASAGARP